MRTLFYRFLNLCRKVFWFITRPIIVGVRVFLVRDGEVLLVRHIYENLWFLPGGGTQRGETIEQAALREAKEEVGAAISDLRLFGIYTNLKEYKTDHIVVFHACAFSINGGTSGEIAEARWFPLAQLPENISPGQRRRIEEFLRGNDIPTYRPW